MIVASIGAGTPLLATELTQGTRTQDVEITCDDYVNDIYTYVTLTGLEEYRHKVDEDAVQYGNEPTKRTRIGSKVNVKYYLAYDDFIYRADV